MAILRIMCPRKFEGGFVDYLKKEDDLDSYATGRGCVECESGDWKRLEDVACLITRTMKKQGLNIKASVEY